MRECGNAGMRNGLGSGSFPRPFCPHPRTSASPHPRTSPPRQRQRERRAQPLEAAHTEIAFHPARQVAADRQAEPDAIWLARGAALELDEGIEDLLLLLAGNAAP